MIREIRVANFRSLRETNDIKIKAINILVGKNSSGKSSLLRLFPLLRQSVESEIKGPLLWYGRLVDFGSFRETQSNSAQAKPVALRFKLDNLRSNRFSPVAPDILGSITDRPEMPSTVASCEIQLGRGDQDHVGLASKLELDIYGDKIEIHIADSLNVSVTLNGTLVSLPGKTEWYASEGRLLPRLYLLEKIASGSVSRFASVSGKRISDWLATKMHKLAHKNTSIERLETLSDGVSFKNKNAFFESMVESPHSTRQFTKKIRELGASSNQVAELRSATLVKALPGILEEIDLQLTTFARGVRYIEPLRASAERYYRLQDLAVDEIDSRGANTAMFLNSLSPHDSEQLQTWTQSIFGFRAFSDRTSGHVAIMIQTGEDSPKNIADLGFGFSQVLPVILQLWFTCIHRGRQGIGKAKPTLIAMEQPELHLHPHYQALLADVFAAVADASTPRNDKVPLFIETHSEHIINRIGALIQSGKLRPEHVQVLLFEKEGVRTTVSQVGFDEDGLLDRNWPFGFFVPEN